MKENEIHTQHRDHTPLPPIGRSFYPVAQELVRIMTTIREMLDPLCVSIPGFPSIAWPPVVLP